jgi:phospholipid/cholesterol/gamma-HCH transport system substrate-binding protein
MKRPTFITWDQLRVGAIILVAIAVVGYAVAKLGESANLFTSRYEVVTFLANAPGLRRGGPVSVAGQQAGVIKEIEFLPVDADTMRNLRIVLSIDETLQEQVREDSRAQIKTLGLLGDKIVDITPGSQTYPMVQPGDTLIATPATDYEQVIAQAAGAVGEVVLLTTELRTITTSMIKGEGTLGQLMTNRSLYDEVVGTLGRTNAVLARFQNPNGTVARLLDDPALYVQLTGTVASLDSLLLRVNQSQGTFKQFLSDTTLYNNMVAMTVEARSSAIRAFISVTVLVSRS